MTTRKTESLLCTAVVCFLVLTLIIHLLIMFRYQETVIHSYKRFRHAHNKTNISLKLYSKSSDGLDNHSDEDHYLLPINFILSKQYPNGSDVEAIQRALKQGHGLEPYLSEKGERAWIENGIVYRPFREKKTGHKYKIKSPFKPEYEEFIPFNKSRFFRGRESDKILLNPTKQKIILWYTKPRYAPPMSGLEPLRVCPDFPCVISSNRNYTNSSSALLFSAILLEPEPPQRRPDQIFIFHNHEIPAAVKFYKIITKTSAWKNAFNWTMMFRMDSDIPAFYGAVRKRPKPVRKNYEAILSNKTKTVAWLVSNCYTPGNREEYVQELQKHISVDIYGSCGRLRCGNRENDDLCMENFSKNVKFYLAFENGVCSDYITEKLFKYFSLDLILVARGSNQYYRHLPSDIFINVNDYPTPKMLAERLTFLDENDEAYINMLRRKDEYISILQDYPKRKENGHIGYMAHRKEETSLCHICYRLWNIDRYSKVIPDIFKLFRKRKCKKNIKIKT